MPFLERPDGARIHWDERGEGPRVLVCSGFNFATSDGLAEELAKSRRVLTFHPRGVGRSSSEGPFDLATGIADVEALLEEAGPVAAAIGVGDGAHRAIEIADRRPDLVDRVAITSTTLGRGGGAEAGGFSGSTEVLGALVSLLRTDYRSGLRSMVANSGADSDAQRDRVEELVATIPQEAVLGYLEAWIGASGIQPARRLGPRLTVIAYSGNAWFPLSMYEALREALTEACFEALEDGPMNRPDLTAGVLLRMSEPATKA